MTGYNPVNFISPIHSSQHFAYDFRRGSGELTMFDEIKRGIIFADDRQILGADNDGQQQNQQDADGIFNPQNGLL